MPLATISQAYDVYQRHDFSREFQFKLLDINLPQFTSNELLRTELLTEKGAVYIQTATIPGRTIQDIDIKYHGFSFHVPGGVQYESPWSVSFKTPGNYLVRNALEQLSFDINSDETSCGNFKMPCKFNTITMGLMAPSDNNQCRIIRTYQLIGVYLDKLGPVSYNIEGTNFTTFDASFHYQYWRPGPSYGYTEGTGTVPVFETPQPFKNC